MNDFLLFDKAMVEYKKFIDEQKESTHRDSFDETGSYTDENISDDDFDKEDYEEENIDIKNLSINEPDTTSSKCKHINISNENGLTTCFDCGKEIEKTIFQDKEWRYYGNADNKRNSDPNRVHIRKIEDRNIFKDVENMKFSDKTISLANQIYLEVTKGSIYRGSSRRSIIFACVFNSLKALGKPQSHEKLMKIFDLSKKNGLRGLKIVNLNARKDSVIHTTYITPANIIDDIMDKFDASQEHKNEVIKLYDKIKNKSSKINRSRPGSIASGIVYFWISLKNINISLKDFATKVDLSELTILKIAKEISEILAIVPECWL
jgi:transcription initiation factor TFIIIB Brf1 subunit/transcription initiation factor TFIIB